MSTSSLQTTNEERKPVLSIAIVHPDVKWKRGDSHGLFPGVVVLGMMAKSGLGRTYLQTDEVMDMIREL
jgi:hypothetical protein